MLKFLCLNNTNKKGYNQPADFLVGADSVFPREVQSQEP